jgi:hypothetical protein
MAAKTPTVTVLSGGNGFVMRKAVFSDIDNTDTWTHGLKNVKMVIPVDNTGATEAGVGVDWTTDASLFTFKSVTANKAVTCLVLSD